MSIITRNRFEIATLPLDSDLNVLFVGGNLELDKSIWEATTHSFYISAQCPIQLPNLRGILSQDVMHPKYHFHGIMCTSPMNYLGNLKDIGARLGIRTIFVHHENIDNLKRETGFRMGIDFGEHKNVVLNKSILEQMPLGENSYYSPETINWQKTINELLMG